MTWFVASIVSVTEITNDTQEVYPIDEDFVLFEAHSPEELNKKIQANMDIKDGAGADGLYYFNKPAKMYCVGVRKIKSIINTAEGLDINEDPPTDGTILSYNFMTVKTLEEAKLLAEGKAVHVYYIDDDKDNVSTL